jgi:hypothetical protein
MPADEKFSLRADEDPMAGAYRSPTSVAAQKRGIESGADAKEQAAFDKGQSAAGTIPVTDDNKLTDIAPGPLTKPARSPLAPFGSAASDTRQRVAALNTESMKLTPPKYTPIPPPIVKTTDPMEVWGSLAMVVAGLGSLKSRQPMTTAMNAAAGVIKGYLDGNKEAADAQYKTWEAATKNAVEATRFEMEAYRIAMDKYEKLSGRELQLGTMEEREASQQLELLAKSYDNPVLAKVLADQGVPGAREYVDRMDKAATDIEKKSKDLSTMQRTNKEFRDYQQAQQALPPEQRDPPEVVQQKAIEIAEKEGFIDTLSPKERRAYELAKIKADEAQKRKLELKNTASNNVIDDETAKFMAQRFLSGDKSALQGFGYGATGQANRAKVQKMIQQQAVASGMSAQDVAIKMQEFMGLGSAERTLGVQSANIGRKAQEAFNLMPLGIELSDKVGRGKFVPLNKLLQAAKASVSDIDLANLKAVTQAIVNTYVAALTQAGTPTDYARKRADDLLTTTTSPESYKATIEIMKREMDAALKSGPDVKEKLRVQYGGTPSKPNADYNVNDIIEIRGKKYLVTGGDMSDPDVEPVP